MVALRGTTLCSVWEMATLSWRNARGDTTLVMGPSGAGKTKLALRFIAQGLSQGERCLNVSF